MAVMRYVFAPRLAPWFGIALLALWLGWLVPAFRTLLAPVRAQEDAAAIVARLQAHSPAARDLARATVFLARSGECRCRADTGMSRLQAALLRSVPALDLGTASSDIGYPVLVLAPPARLVYAGPALVDIGCDAPIALDTLLPALLSRPGRALIVPPTCQCHKEP
ncbi:hypothetical protein [[Pseudomonas] boreopolis]|uniref:hypothetical protein n=1 Tax=Xanthomonas boreopolis TaxID=86183 RepID=UPI003DA0767F